LSLKRLTAEFSFLADFRKAFDKHSADLSSPLIYPPTLLAIPKRLAYGRTVPVDLASEMSKPEVDR